MKLPRLLGGLTKRTVVVLGLVLAAIWLLFIDSHSIVKRVQWHNEYKDLVEEADQLKSEIAELEGELESGLSDETVEEIARENYAMKKKDETVYRVEKRP